MEPGLKLSARLRALADWVPEGGRLADVGSDHAYLPVSLLLQRHIPGAIATELRPGPLARGVQTARHWGCAKWISFRLCDGLSAVRADEVDTVSIAGMGGDNIASILSSAVWTRSTPLPLLLQPASHQPELRLWLTENGYTIERERLVRERERFYTLLLVRAGRSAPLEPAQTWAGSPACWEPDPLREAFLETLQEKAARSLSGLRAAKAPDAARIVFLEQVLSGLAEMRKELSGCPR